MQHLHPLIPTQPRRQFLRVAALLDLKIELQPFGCVQDGVLLVAIVEFIGAPRGGCHEGQSQAMLIELRRRRGLAEQA